MMIAWFVMAALADAVFGSVASRNRGYEASIDQYLARRGVAVPSAPHRPRIR